MKIIHKDSIIKKKGNANYGLFEIDGIKIKIDYNHGWNVRIFKEQNEEEFKEDLIAREKIKKGKDFDLKYTESIIDVILKNRREKKKSIPVKSLLEIEF